MAGALIGVASLDQIPPGSIVPVRMAGVGVALFNVGGRVYAVDDCCVRCGSSLAQGTLRGAEIGCSKCGWHYDVVTGRVSGIPALFADTFEVRIDGSRILLGATPIAHRR